MHRSQKYYVKEHFRVLGFDLSHREADRLAEGNPKAIVYEHPTINIFLKKLNYTVVNGRCIDLIFNSHEVFTRLFFPSPDVANAIYELLDDAMRNESTVFRVDPIEIETFPLMKD